MTVLRALDARSKVTVSSNSIPPPNCGQLTGSLNRASPQLQLLVQTHRVVIEEDYIAAEVNSAEDPGY